MLNQIASTIPKEKVAEFCKQHHVIKLALFGSVLREDFQPDNDIDVLVEFENGKVPGLAFFGMQDELSKIIGRKVDLHTPKSISKDYDYRNQILKEAQTIYVKSDMVRLHQMFHAAQRAIEGCEGYTREDLDREDWIASPVRRSIEMVGEAASEVTPEFQERHKEIPWSNIIGARHRLIHDYDEVGMDIVWSIVKDDLPKLTEQLKEIIEKEK